jgi:flagellar motor switch protein FliG
MEMAEALLKEAPTEALVKSSLSKSQKAALIFLFLEEKGASALFQQMSDEEVKQIGSTLLKMDEIPVEEMSLVLNEFYETMGSPLPAYSGKRIFERLVERSIPDERRGRIFSVDDIKGGRGSVHNPLESMFEVLYPEQVYSLIEDEHAQTIAVVLTLVRPNLSREVLGRFGGELQTDVLYRMSLLSTVSEDVIGILEDTLKPRIEEFADGRRRGGKEMHVPGVDLVLRFLRTQDWGKSETIIDDIEKANPEVARVLRKKVFTLDDLQRTDNSGIRALLKNVETGDLAMALKVASPTLQSLMLQNMSTRAAAILKEDMEVATHRAEDTDVAVERILTEAKNLIKDGDMVLQPAKD